MATLVSYTDGEPLTLDEVRLYSHIDGDDQDALIEGVIIPGARALAESKTGSIIRKGTFTETILLGAALSVGQVVLVEAVKIDGADVAFTLVEKGRRTIVQSAGNEGKEAVVRFTAGTDLTQHPTVKSWLLLACGWMYDHREIMTSGPNAFNEMPKSYVDALLLPIEVPNPF
uniref:head-tail connector protein n=1 Tax=Castellaniella defragrans TaxID=75697 RepID=UPI00334295B0